MKLCGCEDRSTIVGVCLVTSFTVTLPWCFGTVGITGFTEIGGLADELVGGSFVGGVSSVGRFDAAVAKDENGDFDFCFEGAEGGGCFEAGAIKLSSSF